MPRAGELWLADIPFTSGMDSKRRPVLVLWEDMADVVVAAVTKAAPRSPTDVPLHDWASEGLLVASTVRLSRLDCLEQSLLQQRGLGRLEIDEAAEHLEDVDQFGRVFGQPVVGLDIAQGRGRAAVADNGTLPVGFPGRGHP